MIVINEEQRRIETELLDAVIAYGDAFDEFLATSHGGSFDDTEARRKARRKAAEADEVMRQRAAVYRQFVKRNKTAARIEADTSGAGLAKDRLPDGFLKI